jgi:hypothetical protein
MSSTTVAYRWLNSWKLNDLCRSSCAAIALVVLTSMHMLAISNIDQ